MPTINERRLCEAVIRLLEAEHRETRRNVSYPEETHDGPPVEIRLAIGETRYALERTLIEPFIGAIRTGLEFEELVRPILDELDGRLPVPGTYRLLFSIHPTAGRPRKRHDVLRTAIID